MLRRLLLPMMGLGLMLALTACATTQLSTRQAAGAPTVRPTRDPPAEAAPKAPPPASSLDDIPAPEPDLFGETLPQEPGLRAPNGSSAGGELLEGVDESGSTRQALADAIEWTAEGLRLYEQGKSAAARESLTDARIVLLEADLPEVMWERGLMAIHGALPGDLRHHDPESVLAELDLARQASGDGEGADRAFIESEVRRILRSFGATAPGDAYLKVFLDEVSHYIGYYQGKRREFFERSFERKHKYWPTIKKVFGKQNIPVELGYMALVESGFNPRARSRANARGIWQFIPSTGKRYQLRRVDDFYDVEKSTVAASEYLLDLIGIFGSRSFLLAMAAYNTGEGRTQRCLRGLDDPFGGRSFWEIRDCLARETREYVPRIMAAAVIGSDPRRFGFDVATEEETLERYDIVSIPSPTRLSTLASRAGVSVADLRTANTDLASNATSTPVRNFPLYVPKGGAETLVAYLRAAPRSDSPAPSGEIAAVPFEHEVTRVTYRVRRGDTLGQIAGRHGVSLRELAQWNQLRSPYRLQIGQRLTVYPRGGGTPQRLVYTVKKGNTLRAIANIFSVRYRDIMQWNDLRSSTLRVGQKLVIERSARVETYRVRKGDTVAKIARRFGVAVRDVLTANGLGARTVIRPGQRLVVYVR